MVQLGVSMLPWGKIKMCWGRWHGSQGTEMGIVTASATSPTVTWEGWVRREKKKNAGGYLCGVGRSTLESGE